MSAEAWQVTIREDGDTDFIARVMRRSSATKVAVVQADVTSITWKVMTRDGTLVGSGTLTVSSVVYDTLQTGTIWEEDTTGYNFLSQLGRANFPSGNTYYRVEFEWTLTGGTVFHDYYDVKTRNLLGS